MICMFKTRGEAPIYGAKIILKGTLNHQYATVTINGTQYTTAQTLIVPYGSSIFLSVSGSTSKYRQNCKITIFGEEKLSGQAGSYTFQVNQNITITAYVAGIGATIKNYGTITVV